MISRAEMDEMAQSLGYPNMVEMLKAEVPTKGATQLAKKLGVDATVILRRARIHGITVRPRGGANSFYGPAGKEENLIISKLKRLPKELLRTYSREKLAARLNCHPTSISRNMRMKEIRKLGGGKRDATN